jgi:hypothetical protein
MKFRDLKSVFLCQYKTGFFLSSYRNSLNSRDCGTPRCRQWQDWPSQAAAFSTLAFFLLAFILPPGILIHSISGKPFPVLSGAYDITHTVSELRANETRLTGSRSPSSAEQEGLCSGQTPIQPQDGTRA